MKVILKSDVRGIGRKDEVRNVSNGYARNYLIAKGFAVAASGSDLTAWERERSVRTAHEKEHAVRQREIASALDGHTIEFKVKADDRGTVYGSITKNDILTRLRQEYGIGIERAQIALDHPIKTIGDHVVAVRFENETQVSVTVRLRSQP